MAGSGDPCMHPQGPLEQPRRDPVYRPPAPGLGIAGRVADDPKPPAVVCYISISRQVLRRHCDRCQPSHDERMNDSESGICFVDR